MTKPNSHFVVKFVEKSKFIFFLSDDSPWLKLCTLNDGIIIELLCDGPEVPHFLLKSFFVFLVSFLEFFVSSWNFFFGFLL